MKHIRYFSIIVTLSSIITSQQVHGKLSFDSIRSWFGGKSHEAITEIEFDTEDISSLSLENIDGDITIKETWAENKIALTATKRLNKEDDEQNVRISKQTQDGKLMLKTLYKGDVKSAAVNYELIVPTNMLLQLTTKNGAIYLHNTQDPVVACTEYGNIEIHNAQKAIKAQTKTKGSIIVNQAEGNVYATAHHGNVDITDATKNVIAKVTKGKITVTCSELPSTSTIQLETKKGPINLALPASANATIEGATKRGSLTSEHYLTLKSHTTKLNRQAWVRFKKEVHGILGSGEADVKLSADSGNIKILQTKTT